MFRIANQSAVEVADAIIAQLLLIGKLMTGINQTRFAA